MVSKTTYRKNSSKPRSKGGSSSGMVVTASFSYGPFKTKSEAVVFSGNVARVPGVSLGAVSKGSRGFAFPARLRIGVKNASEKAKALALAKKLAPSARISVTKA